MNFGDFQFNARLYSMYTKNHWCKYVNIAITYLNIYLWQQESSTIFIYFGWVRTIGQTSVCVLFWSDGGRRKYYKSRVGRYSHQVPIICLSAIKIPANVLSSDQVVQPWQILGWTWTEHSSSIVLFFSFLNISFS